MKTARIWKFGIVDDGLSSAHNCQFVLVIATIVEANPLIYNTLHFDQYSRIAIRLDIFWFSVNNSKKEFEI